MSDVTMISMQSGFELRAGEHVHKCPDCHESKSCRWTCSIAPDLGVDHGSPAACEDCCRQLAATLGMRAVWPENYAPYFYIECVRCLAASPKGHTPKCALDAAMSDPAEPEHGQLFYSVNEGWMCKRCAEEHARGEVVERAR